MTARKPLFTFTDLDGKVHKLPRFDPSKRDDREPIPRSQLAMMDRDYRHAMVAMDYYENTFRAVVGNLTRDSDAPAVNAIAKMYDSPGGGDLVAKLVDDWADHDGTEAGDVAGKSTGSDVS